MSCSCSCACSYFVSPLSSFDLFLSEQTEKLLNESASSGVPISVDEAEVEGLVRHALHLAICWFGFYIQAT